jgi:membrane-associated phospholipid phosphatase
LHEIKAALVDHAVVVVQRSEGTVGEFTGDGIIAVRGGRPRSALGLARPDALCQCTMSLVTLGPSRSRTSELSLVIGALFRGWRMPTAVALAGLVLALTWLAIGVHVHGWVTAFDAPTAAWIENSVHRSHSLGEAALITARLGNPVTVTAAGLIGGTLVTWRARSLRPGVVVIGTVAGAVLAETAIKAIVYRPSTEADIQVSPLLSTGHHPFPSGHVAGIGALLGIIAACIAVGRSRIVQALATALVVAGVAIVAFSRLYLCAHWLSDVIGGALLVGVFVILGTLALTTRSDQSVRARSAPGPADVFTLTTS